MRRLSLALVAALAAAGCASPAALEGPFVGPDGGPADVFPQRPSTLESVGNAVLSVPETVLWWPYKIVTSTLRGGYDGVADGVGQAPMPVVGVLVSPLTGAAGAVNGALHGIGRGPAWIGTAGEFGSALGKPWIEPIPLLPK